MEAEQEGPGPFYCLLDTGLKRTSTGSKVFACLKGALDGGLDIPHNEKRFVGFADKKLDPEVLKKYIYGGHVSEYQETMQVRMHATLHAFALACQHVLATRALGSAGLIYCLHPCRRRSQRSTQLILQRMHRRVLSQGTLRTCTRR